jgi:hypothetical protein
MHFRLTKRRAVWCFVLLLGGASLVVFLLMLEGSRAELLTQPPGARRSRVAFLGRWAAPVRNTWLQLKLRWSDPPRSVSIASQIFELQGTFSVTNSPGPAPELSSGAGVQVWVLSSDHTKVVRELAEKNGVSVSNPTVSTRDQMPSKISVGHRVATSNIRLPLSGIELDFLPRTRGRSIELAAFLTVGEWLRETNVAIGARVLVPEGQSMFLLSTNRTGAQKQIGLLVTPSIR